MVWYIIFVNIGLYLWSLFVDWLKTILILPFQTADMLWLLVPVWIAWFFSEFFQEKRGTSLGNAISNAVVILWGSIDCSRKTVDLMAEGTIQGFWPIFVRFFIIALIFIYGSFIVYYGLKGDKLIKHIGRIREVTYVFVMFVPIFYNAVELSWSHILAAVLYFPLFYFSIELFDRYTPNPRSLEEDQKEQSGKSTSSGALFPPPRVQLPPQRLPMQRPAAYMPPRGRLR